MIEFRDRRGLIGTIILIVIGLIILSYFGFDLQSIIEADITQRNLTYAWSGVTYVWNNYLGQPILYFWNNIFISLLWDSFVLNLERIKRGEGHEIQESAPSVNTECATC